MPYGSLLLLYTDGLIERRGESLDVGLDRLAGAAANLARVSAGEACTRLLRDMAPPSGFTIHLEVDNADKWWKRAVDAGATVIMPLADQFWGDRYGQLVDPFGHKWSIAAPVKK